MKNIISKFLIVATLLFVGVACASDDADSSGGANSYNAFIAESEILAFAKGSVIKSFNQSLDQVIYNDDRTLFMLSDMNYTSQFTLSVSGTLSLDNSVTVSYRSNVSSSLESGSGIMTVVKADESDSRYWLWDSENSIGFIVDFDF